MSVEGLYTPDGERTLASPQAAHQLLLAWYDASARDLPWRGARDPYAILVSEVMLQQTQVERVVPKYTAFLQRFPTLATLAAAPTAEVIRAWAGLGYNRRAVNLQRLAGVVVSDHGGALPDTVERLRTLPGVGRYTAAAVACFAFGRREPVVDTNVRRVLARLCREAPSTPVAEEQRAARYLPRERAGDWNQALMDLGATICRAQAPTCPVCPLRAICPSRGLTVRERTLRYVAGASVPFERTDRYLRGRIIAALRGLSGGTALCLSAVAEQLGHDTPAQRQRLRRLAADLARDGLLTLGVGDDPDLRLPE